MQDIKKINREKMTTAMKSGDKATTLYARNLSAAIQKKEIDDRTDLDDVGIVKLIASVLKQREESIEQFKTAGRNDLVAGEEAEAKYLRQFMPAQMSAEEIKTLVQKTISETGASGAKDLGKVMKAIQPHIAGKADGKLVNQIVRESLVE